MKKVWMSLDMLKIYNLTERDISLRVPNQRLIRHHIWEQDKMPVEQAEFEKPKFFVHPIYRY